MERGSLRSLMHRSGTSLSTGTKLEIARQVSKGIAFLHENNVIHRDVKPENVLVSRDMVCKIADFGVSKVKATATSNMSVAGTPMYMAPEVIQGKPYSKKADTYSFAVMFCELLCGRRPSALHRFAQFELPDISDLPEAVSTFLKEMWNPNPRFRPSFPEIVFRIERLVDVLSGVDIPFQLPASENRQTSGTGENSSLAGSSHVLLSDFASGSS
eukprot:TRINITY_DN4798_c0_g1_i1.p1 TRINITY_DN4798_c0_g1~~TRINITY_DN4798_c0_g1_i1.p1  ORF type:complete len:214 (-),score=21.49 TRINITY_DN4798_c0_g1_i1:19-660(-)